MKRPVSAAWSAGQALTEYLVVTAALALALLARWGADGSVAERLLLALQRWQRNYLLLLALS